MGRRYAPETHIHIAVANILRLGAPDGCIWWHTPNGGKMDERRGWWLKQLGVRAGVSDFILIHRGRLLCLEIKTAKGRQSEDQREFQADAEAAGASYAVARSSAEAVEIIRNWGCNVNARVAA